MSSNGGRNIDSESKQRYEVVRFIISDEITRAHRSSEVAGACRPVLVSVGCSAAAPLAAGGQRERPAPQSVLGGSSARWCPRAVRSGAHRARVHPAAGGYRSCCIVRPSGAPDTARGAPNRSGQAQVRR